ncbi:MAG: hypothetical protein IJ068_02645 [Bacilli bacterium]|nr:hypothetical protein [Bacilli bacterium]
MQKITTKQKEFFNIIVNLYNTNGMYPTINDLKKVTNYKSYNTIYKYLSILEKKNCIKYDKNRHQITFINQVLKKSNKILIPTFNNSNYFDIENANDIKTIKVADNNLNSFGIYKEDNLILSNKLNYLNNNFVVMERFKKYKIYKCLKKDNFYYLINDKEEFVIENKKLIAYKVVALIRNFE